MVRSGAASASAGSRAVDLFSVAGERPAIPYEDTALPAYFFRAPNSLPGEPRPLVVINNGGDGATSQAWVQGGAAAGERGYHRVAFDGPGRQAALFEQGSRSAPTARRCLPRCSTRCRGSGPVWRSLDADASCRIDP
jgi:hypothetical protein